MHCHDLWLSNISIFSVGIYVSLSAARFLRAIANCIAFTETMDLLNHIYLIGFTYLSNSEIKPDMQMVQEISV